MQFSLSDGLELVFYVALLAFTIHSVIAIYHWFTFGTERSISLIAASIYLIGGGLLIGTMLMLLLNI